MIYCNRDKRVFTEEKEYGSFNFISIGESGRGRKKVKVPSDFELKKGLNKDLTIGKTRSGKDKIIKKEDQELYLILSSSNGYTRRGNGYIGTIDNNVQICSKANGADGDAGRIGSWDEMILKVTEFPCTIRVRNSGGNPSTIVHAKSRNEIYSATGMEDVLNMFDNLDVDVPFEVTEDNKFSNDWKSL